MWGEYKERFRLPSWIYQPSALPLLSNHDDHYALDTIGRDSVYMFFLGNSWLGWGFALLTMAAQMGILFIFVMGSEYDFSDNSDVVLWWKCPRDVDACRSTLGMNKMMC